MNVFKRIFAFYYTGFRDMTVGKSLWLIILIKLFIIFFILRLFFFKPDLSECDSPQQKSEKVIENLLNCQ